MAFPEVPAKLPYESLKSLLLNHVLPTKFQAHERAKFISMIRADYMSCRDFILQVNRRASSCNYGDLLEEQMCDRLVAGMQNLTLQRKLLEKKDLTFAEARKICEQHDDLMEATASEAVTLFQRQKTPPNRPSTAKRAPKPQKDSPHNEKKSIHVCLVELTTYASIAAFVMPNVIVAERLATFGEYVNKLVAILHSQMLQMTHTMCSLYVLKAQPPNVCTEM
ncbi:unnamed protein product [Echinostoma caproni]|uniref:Uncharacterized protein n=1 Tax=Echinostoma caproni TaxID=27848 RepID=A0A183B8J8_9TREM|nr:unnamed protein product [Echinostoma caproni]